VIAMTHIALQAVELGEQDAAAVLVFAGVLRGVLAELATAGGARTFGVSQSARLRSVSTELLIVSSWLLDAGHLASAAKPPVGEPAREAFEFAGRIDRCRCVVGVSPPYE